MKKQSGFTLLEVLVVILLIGILSAIAAPSWLSFVQCQRCSKVQERVQSAVQEAQREAKHRKISYSVSFRTAEQSAQIAVYPVNTSPVWRSIDRELGIPLNQIGISTNAPDSTITFDYKGSVSIGTNASVTVSNLKNPQSTRCLRCITVTTLLGSIQSQKGSTCPSPSSLISSGPQGSSLPPNSGPLASPPPPPSSLPTSSPPSELPPLPPPPDDVPEEHHPTVPPPPMDTAPGFGL